MSKKAIWDYFKGKGFTECGIAGLMGNLQAESNFKSTNLQQTYERSLKMSDAEYTKAVDDGTYTNFVKDSAGYGLAQWTYWSRKQNLLEYARKAGKSIGNLQMQLDFLYSELKGYKKVFEVLKTATTVKEASDIVMLQYERPADQSATALARRLSYGTAIFEEFGTKKQPTTKQEKPASVTAKVDYAKSYNRTYSKAYTTTSDLNLRAGAGTGKDIITVIPQGAKVRCWGYYTVNGSTPWLLVEYKNYTGFCSKKYLK